MGQPLIAQEIEGLTYSTFLGGNNHDVSYGIAVDSTGCAYITGLTLNDTNNFPTTPNAINTTHNGMKDIFVAKISADGTNLIYSTFIGGSDDEEAWGIAVDNSGCAYITGYTLSNNFPTTSNAINQTENGGGDAFISKISADGTVLEYSTFLGGSGLDIGYAIAIDSTGNAYVAGMTNNNTNHFPTTLGAINETHNGLTDAFVSKINVDGTNLEYSTLLGGSSWEEAFGIAVDNAGCAYITGYTYNISTLEDHNFPTTFGAISGVHNGNVDVFVCKINGEGTALDYSTFLGGENIDYGTAITLDSSGYAYVTGMTHDDVIDFPTTSGVLNETHNGGLDAFVCKLNLDGTALEYSTFLGGPFTDNGYAIAVDSTGSAYVTGNAYNTLAFLAKINVDGSELDYSTSLNGSGSDVGQAIAVNNFGSVYLTGITMNSTTNFPTTPGAIDETHNGLDDVFVSKIQITPKITPSASFSANATNIEVGQSIKFTFSGSKGDLPATMQWSFGDGSANVTEENPIHVFTTIGNYTTTLTIIDADGDTDSYSMSISVVESNTGEPEDNPAVPGYNFEFILVCTFSAIIISLKKRRVSNHSVQAKN